MIKIGLVGFNNKNTAKLKKNLKNVKLINIKNLNSKKIFDIEALIAFNFKEINKFLLSKSFINYPQLQWVHVPIAGVDKFMHLFNEMDFKLTCSKKIKNINVSEHVLALILYLSRQIKFSSNFSKKSSFQRPIELHGKY